MVTSDRVKEVIEAVLRAYYRHIGTPAPAPGIEKLAALAVETALPLMREEWEDELLCDDVVRAVEDALPSNPEVRAVIQAAVLATTKRREGS